MRRRTKSVFLPTPARLRTGRDGSLALINVVFLLLVFLLAAGTLRPALPPGLELAETLHGEGRSDPFGAVMLDAEGRLWVSGQQIAIEDLGSAIAARSDPARQLTLLIDRRVTSDRIAAVADRLQAAGIGEITLVTQHRAEP